MSLFSGGYKFKIRLDLRKNNFSIIIYILHFQSEAKMKKPLIAVTMGDPAGIGPEIILKALDDPRIKKACRLLIFGDRQVLESTARRLGKSFSINSIPRLDRTEGYQETVGLYEASSLPVDQVIPGRPDPQWGAAALEYIRLAARSALKGQVAAMVTCPISKEIIRHETTFLYRSYRISGPPIQNPVLWHDAGRAAVKGQPGDDSPFP